MLVAFRWQDYLQDLRLFCRESTNPNIVALIACQLDLQLWSAFNNHVSSIGLDHPAFTEKTSFFHLNQNLNYYYVVLRVPRYQATNIGSRLEYGAETGAISACKGSDKSLNRQIFTQFFASSRCAPGWKRVNASVHLLPTMFWIRSLLHDSSAP